jgi:hypothetical protein
VHCSCEAKQQLTVWMIGTSPLGCIDVAVVVCVDAKLRAYSSNIVANIFLN